KLYYYIIAALLLAGPASAQTGTPKTAAQLNTEVGQTIASGQVPPISALQLRQVLLDMIASSVGTSSGVVASPNTVLSGPASGTASAAPTYRALVAADIPSSVFPTNEF